MAGVVGAAADRGDPPAARRTPAGPVRYDLCVVLGMAVESLMSALALGYPYVKLIR